MPYVQQLKGQLYEMERLAVLILRRTKLMPHGAIPSLLLLRKTETT